MLSQEQKQQYHQNGFLVLENFMSQALCEFLMQQAKKLIAAFDPQEVKTIFSTKTKSQMLQPYFLDSGDKVRFFFEEEAIDEHGELKKEKALCINKIGHGLHDIDPVFDCFSRQHKLALLAQALGIPSPLLVQSMYICKQPHIGGEVTCHQDSTFLYVKDQPVTGLWFALEEATVENGCLWAIPGGHLSPLKSRLIRRPNNEMHYEVYDGSDWPLEKMVPLEAAPGTLIVLHGLLPHMSYANYSAKSRHAYTLHIMSGEQSYPAENWLRREIPFRGFI